MPTAAMRCERPQPVYRSEFMIRLQNSRKEREKIRAARGTRTRHSYELIQTPIEWRTEQLLSSAKKSRPIIRSANKFDRPAVLFNDFVDIYEIDDYDRKVDKVWTRLTSYEKLSIRFELNDFKSREMKVHRESRTNTRFHRV